MKYTEPQVDSSYRRNNIGLTLYNTVLALKPKRIVEFGVLNGYSTIAMAMALDEIREGGDILAYDLWDNYPYKHTTKDQAWANIMKYGVHEYIRLGKCDFYNWVPEAFDLMHVDISNDGRTLQFISRMLQNRPEATILFEGGTAERDNVEWMKKYGKEPMTLSKYPYRVINDKFPGLSMATLYDPIVRL